MMDQPTGTFQPLDSKQYQELKKLEDQAIAARRKIEKPTLTLGEIVEIKGVKFTVTRIKADGKLGLRMVVGG